jgi:hypothetical protein
VKPEFWVELPKSGEKGCILSHRIPKYRKHRSNQARVTLAGTTYYLDKHGTPDSRQRYNKLINEWLTRTGQFARARPDPAVPRR